MGTLGGFKCTCKSGFIGDGVSCQASSGDGGYTDGGNPYADQDDDTPKVPYPTQNPNPTGTQTGIYANLGEGQCSAMGFNWENLSATVLKWGWAQDKAEGIKSINALFNEFSTLGKKALGRSLAKCDEAKAGIVDCKLLYFPHTEQRCLLVQRLEWLYDDIAVNCNVAWRKQFGDMINRLKQYNSTFKNKMTKKKEPCPVPEKL